MFLSSSLHQSPQQQNSVHLSPHADPASESVSSVKTRETETDEALMKQRESSTFWFGESVQFFRFLTGFFGSGNRPQVMKLSMAQQRARQPVVAMTDGWWSATRVRSVLRRPGGK